jgi:hypothetical protein
MMMPLCCVCKRRIARWHNARVDDVPAVEGFWADFCLPCRIWARINLRWYLNGYTW